MDLETIETFVVVAEELHFGRAGQRRHLAQQAVSQQIKRLEAELGVELFHRTTRRVELTQAGLAFESDARELLQQAADMRRRVTSIAVGEQGRCRIGYDPTIVTSVLPHVLDRCRTVAGGVDTALEEVCPPDLERRLQSGRLDICVAGPAVDLEGLDFAVLHIDHPVLVVPAGHPLADAEVVDLADLASEPFVAFDPTTKPDAHDLVAELLARAGADPKVVQLASSELAILGLVAAGCGVGLVTGHAAATTMLPISALPVHPNVDLPNYLLWVPERDEGPVNRIVTAVRETSSIAHEHTSDHRGP